MWLKRNRSLLHHPRNGGTSHDRANVPLPPFISMKASARAANGFAISFLDRE
jgi:hypothetical protein